ncbi:MAG: hypothetical protein RLZZ74_3428 [Cyanobacteriota bacterium]|jgi:hypothetical protein
MKLDENLRFDFVNHKDSCLRLIKSWATHKVMKKPVEHLSFIAEVNMLLKTETGQQSAKPGDVVIISDEEAWVVTKEYFEKNYENRGEL